MMDAVIDLRPIAPAAIVAVTGLVVLLAQAFSPRGKASPSSALSLAGLAAALGSVWLLATGPGRGSVLAGAVAADDFSLFFHALILGVAALTVVWAKELARHQIRVNAIAPGFIKTEMVNSMKPEILEKMAAEIPVGRLGEPDEVAATAEFIFANDYLNGRVLEVDGGQRL